jgi:Nucleotidyl transferase AbiEii toxin, Type IV TA system
MAKHFRSAAAFKTSLETHLRKWAKQSTLPFQTMQLKFVMERLLARLFHDGNPPWLLKGGFALDLRFRPKARTTKDIDLSVSLEAAKGAGAGAAAMRDRLQIAADIDLGDHLVFRIGKAKHELTNAPGGGARYPCEAMLAGKVYAKFQIDIGIGDAVIGTPERLVGDDLLSFAGIAKATVLAIRTAQQFAEKLHAYSFPWKGRENTRTKDLVDLVLLIERGPPDPAEIRQAIATTFATRATHAIPSDLPTPPKAWATEFSGMAAEAGISTTDYLVAFGVIAAFWTDTSLAEN